MALANSLALKLAGVTKDTQGRARGPDRPRCEGRADGHAEGCRDESRGTDYSVALLDEKLAAARAATDHAASLGVTSVQDMSAGDDVGFTSTCCERGELKTRIYAMRSICRGNVLAQIGVRGAFGSEWLRIGGLKGFADGSLGSTTAFFFDPYNDAPNTRGLPVDEMLPEGIMLQRVEAADTPACT